MNLSRNASVNLWLKTFVSHRLTRITGFYAAKLFLKLRMAFERAGIFTLMADIMAHSFSSINHSRIGTLPDFSGEIAMH